MQSLASPLGKVASVCEPIEVKLKFCLTSRLPLVWKKFSKLHFFRQKLSALFQGFPLPHRACAQWGKNCLPCSMASPCLIVLAHNEAKIVCLVPWLPLASSCLRTMRQKLSALSQGFPSGGGSARQGGGEGQFRLRRQKKSKIKKPRFLKTRLFHTTI